MKLMRTLSALPLLALPLSAQVTVEANVSAAIASQDMKKLVSGNSLTGASLGLGLRIPTSYGFGHRLHVNLLGMKGVAGSGLEGGSPKHLYGGWDLTQEAGKNLTVFGGVMAVKWKQDTGAVTNPNFGDIARGTNPLFFPTTNNANNSAKGTKFGVRLGADYTLAKSLSFTFSYQLAEFNKLYNPGWYSCGLSYRFGAK